MATKAVHLELVSALSTEAFLLTLKRFISRRGIPAVIHSDNATNYVEVFPDTTVVLERWTVEYLNRLQNRPKWLSPAKNLEINELILLKEDDVPPLKWPLARIVEIIPGSDQRVRAVKLRTKESVFVRPITKANSENSPSSPIATGRSRVFPQKGPVEASGILRFSPDKVKPQSYLAVESSYFILIHDVRIISTFV
ncbi:hypothetical protein JTB14_026748 [Gonioctena quinquepunctata]|nr:hypothetical protein JTB14_026748 [Gonioctena quinquepunctata]